MAAPKLVEAIEVQVEGGALSATLVRSARRRRTVSLRVAGGTVEVLAPMRMPRSEIEALVRIRAGWLRAQLAIPMPVPAALRDGAPLPYRGGRVQLEVYESGTRGPARLDGEVLRVAVVSGLGRENELFEAVERWYRRETSRLVTEALERLIPVVGRAPSRVFIRSQRRRWGSCSTDGTLRFSWRLAALSPGLLDYVVIHELSHLLRLDHSPAFWALVEAALPGSRARRRALRAEERRLGDVLPAPQRVAMPS